MLWLMSVALFSLQPLAVMPDPSVSPTCTAGILAIKGGACCPKACLRCGGPGCDQKPGGGSQCCGGAIRKPCKTRHGPPPCVYPRDWVELPPSGELIQSRMDTHLRDGVAATSVARFVDKVEFKNYCHLFGVSSFMTFQVLWQPEFPIDMLPASGSAVLKFNKYNLRNIFIKEYVVKFGSDLIRNKDVRDESTLADLNLILREWFELSHQPPYWAEPQWKLYSPAVIMEELVEPIPWDWKFWVFGGVIECVQLHMDRMGNQCQDFYTPDFRIMNARWGSEPACRKNLTRPKKWDLMLAVATKLAGHMDFVRVDLYLVHNRIFAGELEVSFSPGQAIKVYRPRENNTEEKFP